MSFTKEQKQQIAISQFMVHTHAILKGIFPRVKTFLTASEKLAIQQALDGMEAEAKKVIELI